MTRFSTSDCTSIAFRLAPPGIDPDCTCKTCSICCGNRKVEDPKADIVPKLPALVVHAGASDTVNTAEADLHAIPSLFSSLKKYVPTTGKVKFAVTEVALENATEFAVTIALVDELIASTKGGNLFKICTSNYNVCCSVFNNAWTNTIIGKETPSAKDKVPDPLVEITCPLVPSVAGNFKIIPVLTVGELCIV